MGAAPLPSVRDGSPAGRDIVRELRLTTGVLLAVTGMIFLYAWLTPEGTNRGGLRLSLGLALLVQITLFTFATPRVAAAARQGAGGLLGLLTCFGFTTSWVALDGGTASPINAAYFVPLAVAVLRVPTATPVIMGMVTGAHLLAAVLGGSLHLPGALVWISQFVLMTAVTAWIANARAAQRRRLRELTRQLEDLAVRDPLTGVLNRRGFEAALAELAGGGTRTVTVLLVADLDHFKGINDGYGHAVGDEVLVAVARAITDAVREEDLIARTGGEEFAIALLDADATTAGAVAERVRWTIRSCSTPEVTASIGVAIVRGEMDLEQLQLAADRALYQAKRQGRDRLVVTDEGSAVTPSPR